MGRRVQEQLSLAMIAKGEQPGRSGTLLKHDCPATQIMIVY